MFSICSVLEVVSRHFWPQNRIPHPKIPLWTSSEVCRSVFLRQNVILISLKILKFWFFLIFHPWSLFLSIFDPKFGFYTSKSPPGTPPHSWKPKNVKIGEMSWSLFGPFGHTTWLCLSALKRVKKKHNHTLKR